MLARWLQTPAVRRWWGNPARELALLAADLHEPRMHQWIATYRGRPFAYVQSYAAQAWPQVHLHDLPAGTQVVDMFVGAAAMRGRGHGSTVLHLLAERLVEAGAPAVAIDPDVSNRRARRAYRRAGFVEHAVTATDQGRAAVMLYRGQPCAHAAVRGGRRSKPGSQLRYGRGR